MVGRKKQLPIFGVGPLYVGGCFLVTALGLLLKSKGLLRSGDLRRGKRLLRLTGGGLALSSVGLWVAAVIGQQVSQAIRDDRLLTTGPYALVRNPIYTAFAGLLTGILLMAGNAWLLLCPFIFWAYLTVLMIFTEERWLREKFGQDYRAYCRRVNRFIPIIKLPGGKRQKK